MFFRNLTLFRFPTTTKLDDLDTGLEECQLKPVGPLELSSRGFISPFGRDAEALSHRQGDARVSVFRGAGGYPPRGLRKSISRWTPGLHWPG